MHYRFWGSVLVVVFGVGALIFSAVSESSKPVLTVSQLLESTEVPGAVRIGARVSAQSPVEYLKEPQLQLKFHVQDPTGSGDMPVVYYGMMPDTFQAGRDVILEGKFEKGVFVAASLLTQCPSKYRPPVPD